MLTLVRKPHARKSPRLFAAPTFAVSSVPAEASVPAPAACSRKSRIVSEGGIQVNNRAVELTTVLSNDLERRMNQARLCHK